LVLERAGEQTIGQYLRKVSGIASGGRCLPGSAAMPAV
jgi:hypothetical protein